MSLRRPMRRLSVDELLERAASVANLAMLRGYAEPSPIQIAAINEYTHLLKSKLRSLPPQDASTRGRILAQLDIHRSILAPIRRLPKELLIEIFFLLAYESSLLTLLVASTIARVCSVWRHVAHGLTDFWTKVVVKSVPDFNGYCELFLPLTKEMLPDLRCDDREILGPLWNRIEPYASCWRSITLESRLSALPDLKVIYMEKLERLVVDAYDAPVSSELSALDFVVAPRLRHITLALDALQSARQLHVPVTRALSSLEIDVMLPFPLTCVLPLLRACAETLQFLTLKVRHPSDGLEGSYSPTPPEIFVMPALTDLRINAPACALLNHIAAPLLEELVLSNVPEYGTRSLLAFLTRSQAPRHLIDFRVYQPEERDMSSWIPCLQLMHSLRDLHFDDLLSNGQFLKLLIRHPGETPILPSLKNIAIWHIFHKHTELQELIRDMCKSRAVPTIINGRQAVLILRWLED